MTNAQQAVAANRAPNREYESLIECGLPDGHKVRVWLTQPSLEAAAMQRKDGAAVQLYGVAKPMWPDFRAIAEAVEAAFPSASAIAVTDAAGNGLTLYPDWK